MNRWASPLPSGGLSNVPPSSPPLCTASRRPEKEEEAKDVSPQPSPASHSPPPHLDELLLRMSRVAVATLKSAEKLHSPTLSARPPSSSPPLPPSASTSLHAVYVALATYFQEAAAAKKRQQEFAMQKWELGVVVRYVFRELYRAAASATAHSRPAHAIHASCTSVHAFLACSPVSSLSALRSALREEQIQDVQRGTSMDSHACSNGEKTSRITSTTAHPLPTLRTPPPLSHCFAEVVALCHVLETNMVRFQKEEANTKAKEAMSSADPEKPMGGAPSALPTVAPLHTSPHAIRLVHFLAVAITLWPVVYLSDILHVVVHMWKADAIERRTNTRTKRVVDTHEGQKVDTKEAKEEEEDRLEAEVAWTCIASVLWCWSQMDKKRASALRSLSAAMMHTLHSWSSPSLPRSSLEAPSSSSLSPLSWHTLWDLLQEEVVWKGCPSSLPGEENETYASVWRSYPDAFCISETPSPSPWTVSPSRDSIEKEYKEHYQDATWCSLAASGSPSSSFATTVKDLSVDSQHVDHRRRYSDRLRSVGVVGAEQVEEDGGHTKGSPRREKSLSLSSSSSASSSSSSSSSFSPSSKAAIDFRFWGALAATPPPLFSSDAAVVARRSCASPHEKA